MPINSEQFLNPKEILESIGIKQDMVVADFGCGSGYIVFAAAKLVGPKSTVYAVDVQKHLLDHIKTQAQANNILGIKPVWANLEIVGGTKIPAESLDLVILANTLYQSSKQKEIISEAKRVLKNAGMLLVVEWKGTGVPFGPPTSERVDSETVKNFAFGLNLNKIKEFEAGKYHYGLLFKK